MKKFLSKYLKKSILFYTFIFSILFVVSNLLTSFLGYSFLKLTYTIVLTVSTIGIIIGTVQVANWLKNKKVFFCVLLIIITMELIISAVFIFLYNTIYPKEEKVTVDNKQMVKISHYELISNDIEYYDYINSFIRGKKIKIFEDYSDGVGSNYLHNIYYYDDNENLVKQYDNDKKKTIYVYKEDKEKAESKKNLKNIEKSTNEVKNSEEVIEPEILYKKDFDEKTSIRVINKGYILAQRSIIGFEKTYDGGKTWTEQIENEDKFIQIHNGADFVFLTEYVGFINDHGLAGTDGENRGLLVTTDGGKNFNNVIIKSEELKNELYIDELPYKENNILKLRAYTIENSEKKYHEFYSKDNGIMWELI